MIFINSNRYAAIIADSVERSPSFAFGVRDGMRPGVTQLTAIYRHPVMGGEDAAPEKIRRETASVLRCCESTSDLPLRDDDQVDYLKNLISRANTIAQHCDSFFSAQIFLIEGNRAILTSIGHASAFLCRRDSMKSLIEPTILTVPAIPLEEALLTASLGPGFDSSKIQTCQLTLENSDLVLLTMKSRFESVAANHYLDDGTVGDSLLDWLLRLDKLTENTSSYLAAVKAS